MSRRRDDLEHYGTNAVVASKGMNLEAPNHREKTMPSGFAFQRKRAEGRGDVPVRVQAITIRNKKGCGFFE
jgi:hypothetical protein